MTFVDAKNVAGTIFVSELSEDGDFKVNKFPAQYMAYQEDPSGPYKSITGKRLRKVIYKTKKALLAAKEQGLSLWESDINPTFRFLEDAYPDDGKLPPLRITIFDIEVDRDPKRGYSTTDNPFNPVTSITVYHKWKDQAITIAVPPPNMSIAEATRLINDVDHEDGYGALNEDKGYYLVADETSLLELFVEIIQETDILTGWNSELYDLPYLINRSRVVIGGEPIGRIQHEPEFNPSPESEAFLQRFSVFPVLPDVQEVEVYGRREKVYQLLGRKHVDYLVFYKKFVKAELLSFTLDAILNHEVKQTKVKYDGTIDDFYRNEFRRFLAYNRQDVMGLSAIDDKRKLIDLANQMIHMSGVTMDKAAGSVAKIEQAVLRELHRHRHEIAWDRIDHKPDRNVPGAFVVTPRGRKYGWGASYDVNSLYPTMIRLLNISPETMVGQLDLTRTDALLNERVDDFLKIPREDRVPMDDRFIYRRLKSQNAIDLAYREAWHTFTGSVEYHDVIEGKDHIVKLILLDGKGVVMSARAMRDYIRENNWCVTANGTVFTLDKEGIIPYCLTKWFKERQEFRKQAGVYKQMSVDAKNAGDKEKAAEYAALADYYNMIQEAKKVFLNSTYGAYLNRFFRFYDPRCGRSVTLSGRVVVKHMCRKSCELLAGNYDFDNTVLLAGDTDSCYISFDEFLDREQVEKTADNVCEIADWLGDQINDSFLEHLAEQFLVPKNRVGMVQVKREAVFDRAIFKDKKKRYAMHIVDKEGTRIPYGDKDELKIIGMETRRSDTPRHIQDFLSNCLSKVLVDGYEEEEIRKMADEFREDFRKSPPWKRGSPVRLNNFLVTCMKLDEFDKSQDDQDVLAKKPQAYWACVAARNTNLLMEKFNEPRWEKLRDGDKVEILYLKPNDLRVDLVAIRVGEDYIPDWFKLLPFDDRAHEQKLIDQKLSNVFGGLGWEFSPRDHTGYDIFV
jgi:DNA polymerase elongation subunit (family B)